MMLILFASLIIFVIIFMKFIDKFKNKRFYELSKQFPSYPTYPLIGNLHMLCGTVNDLLGKLRILIQPHDRVFFWLGPFPILILKKHDDIVNVLTQTQNRDLLGFGEESIGIGILNAKYDEWKISRRLLAPAFSTEMLSAYVNIFKKNSLALVDVFKSAADSGEVVDVWEDAIQNNIHSILEIAIGAPMDEEMQLNGKEYGDAMQETVQSVIKQVITPWLQPSLMYHAYLKLTGRSKFIHRIRAFPAKILRDKLNEYKNGENSSKQVDSAKTITNLLIRGSQVESSYTEIRMTNELTHILVAAIETTALNLCFSMLMLAIHQDVQQKVYQETEEFFKDNETVTADHLFNGLKYMEQCIRETSRIFPHVTFTVRRTHKECALKDGVIIPANTMVVPFIYFANQDPSLYENPQKWDPEHFSPDAVKNRPKNSFMSFGYGPRSCIGIRYAMLSIKTQMAYILRHYHLTTNIKELTDEHLKTDLCIRSKLGYPIKFTKRKDLK